MEMHVTLSNFSSRILRNDALVYNYKNSRFAEITVFI